MTNELAQTIRGRIETVFITLDKLNSLPSHDTLRWPEHALFKDKNIPSVALLIGKTGPLDLFAYISPPNTVKYGMKSAGDAITAKTHNEFRVDEVMKELKTLYSPFRDLATYPSQSPTKQTTKSVAQSEKRFTSLVMWYFIEKGVLRGRDAVNLEDFSKHLSAAVNAIHPSLPGSKNKQPPDTTSNTQDESQTVDWETETIVAEESRPSQSVRDNVSKPTTHQSSQSLLQKFQTRTDPLSSRNSEEIFSRSSEEQKTDYEECLAYLKENNVEYLLENLPDLKALETDFVKQTYCPSFYEKKLFIGKRRPGADEEVYAYLSQTVRNAHGAKIEFWSEYPRKSELYPVDIDDIHKCSINHPYNKTYPEESKAAEGKDPTSNARLRLMIKWCFLSGGVAPDLLDGEPDRFHYRLQVMLHYVAQRMGKGAAKPPSIKPSSLHPTGNKTSSTTPIKLTYSRQVIRSSMPSSKAAPSTSSAVKGPSSSSNSRTKSGPPRNGILSRSGNGNSARSSAAPSPFPAAEQPSPHATPTPASPHDPRSRSSTPRNETNPPQDNGSTGTPPSTAPTLTSLAEEGASSRSTPTPSDVNGYLNNNNMRKNQTNGTRASSSATSTIPAAEESAPRGTKRKFQETIDADTALQILCDLKPLVAELKKKMQKCDADKEKTQTSRHSTLNRVRSERTRFLAETTKKREELQRQLEQLDKDQEEKLASLDAEHTDAEKKLKEEMEEFDEEKKKLEKEHDEKWKRIKLNTKILYAKMAEEDAEGNGGG